VHPLELRVQLFQEDELGLLATGKFRRHRSTVRGLTNLIRPGLQGCLRLNPGAGLSVRNAFGHCPI
jgi:hypothetical protein